MEPDRPPQPSPETTDTTGTRAEQPVSRLFHDARGCLNGIQLNLTLLKRSVAGDLDHLADLKERNQGWVTAVCEEVDRLTELIERAAKAFAPDSRTPKS